MDEVWKTIERGTEKVSQRLLELAQIKSGSKVLDIATGIGEPAITAAGRVGSSGHVLPTDISPQMCKTESSFFRPAKYD